MSDIWSKTYASRSSVQRAAKGAGIDDYEIVEVNVNGETKFAAKQKGGGEVTELPELVPTEAKATTEQKTEAPKAKKRVGVVEGPTKKDAVIAVYKKHNGEKDKVIDELINKHGMSKAGANTYFYNVKGGRWTEEKKKKAA